MVFGFTFSQVGYYEGIETVDYSDRQNIYDDISTELSVLSYSES